VKVNLKEKDYSKLDTLLKDFVFAKVNKSIICLEKFLSKVVNIRRGNKCVVCKEIIGTNEA
jgi:hypothetical protein